MQGLEAETIDLFDLFAKISLDTSEYDSGVKDVTKSGSNLASKLKSGIASAGKIAAAGIGAITTAAGAAVGGLLALEQSTEEYRIAMGRLNTAFESAGYGADAANQAYSEFYGILGDTDRATEASQLLAKLANNEEDLAEWTNIAAGVNGTFGDSLPIESLIEAANETARTGTVVGTLADALNWAGTVGEDEFNAMLASCSSESERNQLIMETLAGTYDEAANAFYRNNDALVKSRENQAKLDESLAKVGDSVATVKNALLEEFSPAISEISTKLADFISGIDTDALVENITSFVNTIVDNGPTIISLIAGVGAAFIAWNVVTTIQGVISAIAAFRAANEGATIAQLALNAAITANPIGIVVAAITGLIAIIGALWVTNEDFRNAVIEIWENIKQAFITAWENIKAVWDVVQPYFQAIWDAIQSVFSVVADVLTGFFSAAWSGISAVWDVATGFFENIWNTIKGIFSVVESVLSGDFEGAWEAIKDVFSGWGDFFSGLWEDITNVFSSAWDWFSNIGSDIVNGIKSGIKNAWDTFVNWVGDLFENSLVGKVLNALGIHSPSKVFADIGENMVLGLGRGWDNSFGRVQKSIESSLSFGSGTVDFASSGLGLASAGAVNGIVSAVNGRGNVGPLTVNLVLPDGTKLASYLLGPLADYAKANGTPILNPA